MAWYVAQTHVGQEERATVELARQGIGSLLLKYNQKKDDRHVVTKLLFSNYLLVELDSPYDWPAVHHTYGVNRMLVCGDSQSEYLAPQRLLDRTVESLREQAQSYDEIERLDQAILITEGCYVKVKAGIFKDEAFAQRALVTWSEQDRARLRMSMFKREVEVEFYHRDLVKLA